MAGGSGSRNSTPPVGHPSSTPTPPQVRTAHRLPRHFFRTSDWNETGGGGGASRVASHQTGKMATASPGICLAVLPTRTRLASGPEQTIWF